MREPASFFQLVMMETLRQLNSIVVFYNAHFILSIGSELSFLELKLPLCFVGSREKLVGERILQFDC